MDNLYTTSEQRIISRARNIIAAKWEISEGEPLSSPGATRDYIKMHLASENQRETFVVMYLNAQHRLLLTENLFVGTIDGAAVYPREIVRRSLEMNANAIIIAHNHPSGEPHPSTADKRITERIAKAVGLVDIRLLDHVIVAGDSSTSFAEEGLI